MFACAGPLLRLFYNVAVPRLTAIYTIGIVQRVDGSELRRLRVRARLSQAALASHLSVTPNTVARWERNERKVSPAMERLITMTLTARKRASKREGT